MYKRQEQWKEQNKIRQEIQQQNEMLKLENNKLQNHISNYAQSLKEKSKELESVNFSLMEIISAIR